MTRIEEAAYISRIVLLGDQRAFEKLMDCHLPTVRRFFMMQTEGDEELSKDLAQETFIKAWQKIGAFQMASSFSTWLYRIAYNLWQDHLRSIRYESESIDNSVSTSRSAEATMRRQNREISQERERQAWVAKALAQMPEPEKTCISLFYLEEMSSKEVSRITGIAEPTVRTHLSRGRKRLKEILETITV